MNKLIRNFLKAVILTAIFSSAVHAEHDNGQGKSQDDPLGSVSVAPEPSTFWLFSGFRHRKDWKAGCVPVPLPLTCNLI